MTAKADQQCRYWLTDKGYAALAGNDYCEIHDCESPCPYCAGDDDEVQH